MSKTILLSGRNRFSSKANLWLHIFAGILFLMNGALSIYSNNFNPVGFILGILILASGLYYLIYGFMAFSKKSKFAPRVKLDEREIVLKNNLFKPATSILWSDVKRINFGTYELNFHLTDKNIIFQYETDWDRSVRIKTKIMELSKGKDIEVVAG